MSPAEQAELCLDSLTATLAQRGCSTEDVLQVSLYLTDLDAYEDVNAAYERYFAEPYPARTTLGVSELLGGASVQLDAVVAVE